MSSSTEILTLQILKDSVSRAPFIRIFAVEILIYLKISNFDHSTSPYYSTKRPLTKLLIITAFLKVTSSIFWYMRAIRASKITLTTQECDRLYIYKVAAFFDLCYRTTPRPLALEG